MADLYSVIPGLVPTQQELLEAELLVKQVLEAKFPTLDLREGTGLRDLVIRPTSMAFAMLKKSIDYTQTTLAGSDDNTPTEVVDALLSNWFLTRNIGTKSVISARLYFARPKNTSISSSVFFSTDNVAKFFPEESLSFPASAMVLDTNSDEYYLDVDLTAEQEGSGYNIGSGSLLYFSNFDPYFLRAEINYLKSASIDTETNTQFISRAETAISTRNLINVPSIDQNLKAAFNYINRLVSIGMGDPEMLRDEIKAVFDAKAKRQVQVITNTGREVTVTLANHGYNSGQLVRFSGATPDEYNLDISVTVLDSSHFTYTSPGDLNGIYTLPYVEAVDIPTYIHNGGMVDVYCSDQLANALVQVTLNEFGQAHLTGPIYKVSRSAISGGPEDDTCPLVNTAAVASITFAGNNAVVTTTSNHVFTLADKITVTGAVQKQQITSLSANNHVVTVVLPGHKFLAGDSVIIDGVTPSTYNGTFTITYADTNTFTYTAPEVTLGSGSGSLMRAEVALLNGVHTPVSVTNNTFSFDLGRPLAAPVTGTMSSSAPVPYKLSNYNSETKSISRIECSGNIATASVPNHGYMDNRHITITNASISAYNGTWLINDIPNSDQFSFMVPSTLGVATSATSDFTVPWRDYGFSQKQDLLVDMGVPFANTTASFEIDYFQNLSSIQDYLDLAKNRVLCGDLLARGFNFYTLDVEITSYNQTAPSSNLVAALISSYLASLVPGATFIVTDMVAKLRVNGIINIQNPPLITYKKYTRDLTPEESGSVTDVLDPNDRTNVFLLGNVTTKTQNIAADTLTIL